MKSLSSRAVVAVVMVMMVLMLEAESGADVSSNAVNCSPAGLRPCLPALNSPAPPTSGCCSQLRIQKPCLCGYMKDPNLKTYLSSPNAKKVSTACGVPLPKC
ncbi:non-specific lipid-transfer protein 2-like [Mercurialis annua]|uniref:non-specific lipid-transfer protein 2-like n=1 Tax=Mercurialis annua TaxID=3986 RepID=UPI002160994D|nr:non-specific lipid-transfer protein 2-like [Mercurialis annua]